MNVGKTLNLAISFVKCSGESAQFITFMLSDSNPLSLMAAIIPKL